MSIRNGRLEIEKADDGSFIVNIYTPSPEDMMCECLKVTSPDEKRLLKKLPEYLKLAFEGVRDEFEEAFKEDQVEQPTGYVEISIERHPRVIKHVDDTPLTQMTPVMVEKNKRKMIKE